MKAYTVLTTLGRLFLWATCKDHAYNLAVMDGYVVECVQEWRML
jgi:hypothetical protein